MTSVLFLYHYILHLLLLYLYNMVWYRLASRKLWNTSHGAHGLQWTIHAVNLVQCNSDYFRLWSSVITQLGATVVFDHNFLNVFVWLIVRWVLAVLTISFLALIYHFLQTLLQFLSRICNFYGQRFIVLVN